MSWDAGPLKGVWLTWTGDVVWLEELAHWEHDLISQFLATRTEVAFLH